ncbi:MAG: hypothetical protein CSA62_05495 [Planctomycetota bacterium]|nr:MAG: hypothetical protein CSA62_05495 [Planctomycetota bacterium]
MLPHKSCLPALLFLALSIPSYAQNCGAGSQLLKNDQLPANPTSFQRIALVPGVCPGDAVMSILDAGAPATIYSVSVGFAHKLAVGGARAIVDVEIYDGATPGAGGRYKLGPLLFTTKGSSSNLQLASTGINNWKLPTPVKVSSGKAVIGFRMVKNYSGGSCQLGFNANFFTDNATGRFPGKNILDDPKHGPIDPFIYTGFGLPLYPIYYKGNWVIRACIKKDVSVAWAGSATPGGFVSLTYNAPRQAGDQYFVLASGGISTGFPSPWGRVPLNFDPIFNCFLSGCRSTLINPVGTFNAQGQAFGALRIPNIPSLKNSGLKLYIGFVTYSKAGFFPWKSISAPSRPIIIN